MADVKALKKDVCDAIDGMSSELIRISHEIHAHPELNFQEHFAAKILTEAVEKADLPVERKACGLDTAYISEFGSGDGSVGILSEYDALPGIGHACGHNIIAVTGLGASIALSKLGAKLPGVVRYLGTPAEEGGGGKELMAREGAFDGLDGAMMVHPAGMNLATMPCLAMTCARVTYRGRTAHASAMPHRGINALDALVLAYQGVAQLRQQIKPTNRLHAIIKDGGQAMNVIPERAVGVFCVRGVDMKDVIRLKERVQGCFEGAALSTGCEAEIEWDMVSFTDMKTSWPMARAYQENAEGLGREFIPLETLPASMAGSTDMGNISHRVPSIHPMIASAPLNVTIHNPEFTKWAKSDLGDQAAIDGAKSLAMTAIDYLTDADMRALAAEEFKSTKEDSDYTVEHCFNPDGTFVLQEAFGGGCGC